MNATQDPLFWLLLLVGVVVISLYATEQIKRDMRTYREEMDEYLKRKAVQTPHYPRQPNLELEAMEERLAAKTKEYLANLPKKKPPTQYPAGWPTVEEMSDLDDDDYPNLINRH